MKTKLVTKVIASSALLTLAGALVACSSGGDAGHADDGERGLDEVSLILDWTPNTNHTGLFVAQELGYYEEAGIELTIQGFSDSGVESVLDAGGADFGISGATSLTFADAAGADLISVFNVAQVPSSRLAVNEQNSDVSRPADLDGKTYAGFGQPFELAVVQATIQGDGGTGEFESVSLSTAAYDALYSGDADFAAPLLTWEGVEADLNGTPLKYFDPADYGVPATPSEIGISTQRSLTEQDPDLVERFVQATQRGYQYAVDHPEEAGEILVEANPEANLDPNLVQRSQALLSSEYWPDEAGRVGKGDKGKWDAFVAFLQDEALLNDENGEPLTRTPDVESLFTNEFLAES